MSEWQVKVPPTLEPAHCSTMRLNSASIPVLSRISRPVRRSGRGEKPWGGETNIIPAFVRTAHGPVHYPVPH